MDPAWLLYSWNFPGQHIRVGGQSSSKQSTNPRQSFLESLQAVRRRCGLHNEEGGHWDPPAMICIPLEDRGVCTWVVKVPKSKGSGPWTLRMTEKISSERSGVTGNNWWLRWQRMPAVQETCVQEDLSPGSGRSPGEGNSNPLQYSCLENPMDRGAWQATVHEVTKSQTWLSDWYLT